VNILPESWLAIAYCLSGPGVWGVFALAMYKGQRRLTIRLVPPPVLETYPPVSVIVPCRNESRMIGECLASIVAQDYADLEVIAVNDRSTDDTGRVIDELSSKHERLRTVHVTSLPEGWLGKPNAAAHGAAVARGRWLVFVDSDCTLAPHAVREAIVTGEHRRFDLVSFVPRFVGTGFWDSLMTPLCGIATSGMFSLMYANSAMLPRIAFACGQFIAIRRDVYDGIGGHAAVRDSAGEDVELARILKRQGLRPRLGWGLDLVTTRMYGGLNEVINGWGRNFVAASRGRPWRVLGAITFVFGCVLTIWPAAVLGDWRLRLIAIIHGLLMTLLLAMAYRQAGSRAWRAVLWPFSSLVLLCIFVRALWVSFTRRLTWRGQQYSLK